MSYMAKRTQNAFLQRQKEIKRQQKAQEKMARRHGLKSEETEEINEETAAPVPEAEETAADQTPEDHT